MTTRTRDFRLLLPAWLLVVAAVTTAVVVGRAAPPAVAGDHGGHGGHQGDAPKQGVGLLVDLGNTKCPGPMGGKPDGHTFSEWNGLRIGHCCGMCTSKFLAAAERSLKQAKIEWEGAAAAVKKVNEAKGIERVKALEDLKKKWTVVREPLPEVPGTLVDLANPKCPVEGDAVDGTTSCEWRGLKVSFCCAECIDKFAADAEKLLAAAKIDWKPAADAVKALEAAKGADRATKLAALKKKYKVVRDPSAEAAK